HLGQELISNFLAERHIYRGSKIQLQSENTNQLEFIPPIHGDYIVTLTGRGAGAELSMSIPFSVEPAPFSGSDLLNDLPSWRVIAQYEARAMFKQKEQCAPDGSACLSIETPAGVQPAGHWGRRIHAKPQTAYLLTAKVRATDIQYPNSSVTDHYRGPYIGIGQFGPARRGISRNPDTDWEEVKIDFATTPTGVVDIHISMGEASGNFYVHSIELEPLEQEVTRFESQHMILNVYNEIVVLA